MGARVRLRWRALFGTKRVRRGESNSMDYRNLEGERAAFALGRVDSEVSLMHACDLARQPQAKPCSGDMHSRFVLDAAELREQLLVVGWCDPYPLVDDDDLCRRAVAVDDDGYRRFRPLVLDRVDDQVPHHDLASLAVDLCVHRNFGHVA